MFSWICLFLTVCGYDCKCNCVVFLPVKLLQRKKTNLGKSKGTVLNCALSSETSAQGMLCADTSRLFVVQCRQEQAADVSICLAEKIPIARGLRCHDKQQCGFPNSAETLGHNVVLYCREHFHLFKRSLAGTMLICHREQGEWRSYWEACNGWPSANTIQRWNRNKWHGSCSRCWWGITF